MYGKQADAGSPPADPAVWIADLNALGCQAGAVYILGGAGAGKYTPAHVAQALAAGKYVSAVVVPQSSGFTPAQVAAAAAPYDFPKGTPLWDDVANGDHYTGTPAQVEAIVTAAAPAFTGGVYAQPGLRTTYPWGLFWSAEPENPPPTTLPAGTSAIQYGQAVGPSGTVYDLSLIDLSIFGVKTMSHILHDTDGDGAQYIMPEGYHIDGYQSQQYTEADIPMVNMTTAEAAGPLGASNVATQALVAALAAQVTALAAQVTALQAAVVALPAPATPAAVEAVQTAVEALPAPSTPAAVAEVQSGVDALQAAVAKIPTDPPAPGTGGEIKLSFAGTYKGGSTSGTATGSLTPTA